MLAIGAATPELFATMKSKDMNICSKCGWFFEPKKGKHAKRVTTGKKVSGLAGIGLLLQARDKALRRLGRAR